MTEVKLHVTSLFVDQDFNGDVPDEILEAAKNLRQTNQREVYDAMSKIGDQWINEAKDAKENLLRSAVFDNLCGIDIADGFVNIIRDDEIGASGGRKSGHIYDSNIGTGLSRQGKTPRDL